jgi:hypothetical protein
MADDEQTSRERAERLREAVREVGAGSRRPRTPREFTEERAREAAAEERARIEGAGDDEDEEEA